MKILKRIGWITITLIVVIWTLYYGARYVYQSGYSQGYTYGTQDGMSYGYVLGHLCAEGLVAPDQSYLCIDPKKLEGPEEMAGPTYTPEI
jgi:hypothetical protein